FPRALPGATTGRRSAYPQILGELPKDRGKITCRMVAPSRLVAVNRAAGRYWRFQPIDSSAPTAYGNPVRLLPTTRPGILNRGDGRTRFGSRSRRAKPPPSRRLHMVRSVLKPLKHIFVHGNPKDRETRRQKCRDDP